MQKSGIEQGRATFLLPSPPKSPPKSPPEGFGRRSGGDPEEIWEEI